MKKYLLLAGSLLSLHVTAGTMGVLSKPQDLRWSAIISIGYTNYQSMYSNDGQTALGRIAFARKLGTFQYLDLGLEIGVQNGNTMRLNLPDTTLNDLGGLPIDMTVKPSLDLLGTLRSWPINGSLLYAEFKGGIVYYKAVFGERTSISNLSAVGGEIQAGLGYPLSQRTTLSLLYQGIFSGHSNFSVNTSNQTGRLSAMPIQQGGLLSISFTV